ncbi:MAG: hypothetical protein JOZ53_24170 [Planctomycetaceae bacterium]|nr:hypothetical protein [Planctomycetaceae bacterium]
MNRREALAILILLVFLLSLLGTCWRSPMRDRDDHAAVRVIHHRHLRGVELPQWWPFDWPAPTSTTTTITTTVPSSGQQPPPPAGPGR